MYRVPNCQLKKGLSSKEGVKLFFICCQGLGGLLLFMSATVDPWVRGKTLLWDVTYKALKLFSKVHKHNTELSCIAHCVGSSANTHAYNTGLTYMSYYTGSSGDAIQD